MIQNRAALEILAAVIPDWTEDALCREHDPDLWFPEGYGKEPAEKTARAIVVCNQCPVQQECYDYSLATKQRHGTWGGVDERTRAKLLVGMPRLPRHLTHGSESAYRVCTAGPDGSKCRECQTGHSQRWARYKNTGRAT